MYIQSKEKMDRRPTTQKIVSKWVSGVHLELGFLSHNVRGFTHFCNINRGFMRQIEGIVHYHFSMNKLL